MGNDVLHPKMTFANELRFTPYAWAKMLYMRDRGHTEVAGYGVTETDDPLLVTDFRLIRSDCTDVSFDMDPNDGAEFMETMMDAGLMPWQYSNILIHTHPGNSPIPSGMDENNFVRAFSHPNWAIMFIIAEGGASYCRIKVNVGPGIVKDIKVAIDWSIPFCGSDTESWNDEYAAKVVVLGLPLYYTTEEVDCNWTIDGDVQCWNDYDDGWYIYDPVERKWYFTAELDEKAHGVKRPEGSWVKYVIEWAEKHAEDRQLAMRAHYE